MKRGGYRPGGGRPKKIISEIFEAARGSNLQPLDYMIAVMNDATVDANRRDRMAIAAAPYCHARLVDDRAVKKRKQAKELQTAGAGTAWKQDLEFVGNEIRATQ